MRRRFRHFSPAAKLWYLSTLAYRRRLLPAAIVLKLLNYVLFRNILCFEAKIEPDLRLEHFGTGSVINGNTTIGHGVRIFHQVSFAYAERVPNASSRIIVEDDVLIGAYAILIAGSRSDLHIGRGAKIGAGAIVVHDVPAGATVIPAASSHRVEREAKR